jgi:hypothetical protein
MVFSRFPFLVRPNVDHFEFRRYAESAGDDALSDMNVQSGKYVLHAIIGKWRF